MEGLLTLWVELGGRSLRPPHLSTSRLSLCLYPWKHTQFTTFCIRVWQWSPQTPTLQSVLSAEVSGNGFVSKWSIFSKTFNKLNKEVHLYLQIRFSSDLILKLAACPLQDIYSRLTDVDPQGCRMLKDKTTGFICFYTLIYLIRLTGSSCNCTGVRSSTLLL